MIILGLKIDTIFIYVSFLLILLIIYISSGTQTKVWFRKILIRYWFFLLIFGFLIYGWDKWGIVSEHEWIANMKYALFLGISFFMFYMVGRNWIYEFRYNTANMVANGIHGSCALHYDAGNYTIWYLGTTGRFSVDSEGIVFPFPFPNKIAITPKVSWDINGDNYVSITQVMKVDINEIPNKLKEIIVKDKKTIFARDNVFFGIVSEKIRTDEPKWDELENELKQVNAKYNTLAENFHDVTTSEERYVGHARRVKLLSKETTKPKSQQGTSIEQ